MPKILNERYKLHFRVGHFDLMHPSEFYKKLNTIKAQPHLLTTLKYYFLLLYWTGRRPVQVLEFKREHFRETTKAGIRYLEIECLPKKGENPVTIYLVFDNIPLLQKAWEWLSTAPMDFKPFYLLFSNKKNHLVNWTGKAGQKHQKTYDNLSARVFYWANKFFEVPPYFFRHNAYSYLVNVLDADFNDIKFWKGAKTEKSVACYIHPSQKKLQAIAQKLKAN